jgi:hypothetical protein
MKSIVYGLILSILSTLVALFGFDFDGGSTAHLGREAPWRMRDDYAPPCALFPSAADIELNRACARWR